MTLFWHIVLFLTSKFFPAVSVVNILIYSSSDR